ncbi:LapA family protein [Salinibacter grassmerensis]|uniref:LapA family protein n=1 Tax=Salinibacter grassmerensis TaxID=3040353 RepID=UPI0021E847B4|nr:LapA family protein [Salinibacter grassmerensis]
MRLGLVFSLILAIFAVVFALQNPQTMDVNLLFFQTQGSTALILILTFGFGVLVGLLSTLPKQLRTRRKLNELRQEQEGPTSSSPVEPPTSSPESPRPGGTESDAE